MKQLLKKGMFSQLETTDVFSSHLFFDYFSLVLHLARLSVTTARIR